MKILWTQLRYMAANADRNQENLGAGLVAGADGDWETLGAMPAACAMGDRDTLSARLAAAQISQRRHRKGPSRAVGPPNWWNWWTV